MARPHIEGQLGLFRPESDWQVPSELPDLRGRPIVALDTETRDVGLSRGIGAGWAFGQGAGGYICGVSWAAEGSRGYAPVRHPETDCLPVENVMRWVDDLLRSGTRVVFHNGPYDVGWLGTSGVAPPPHESLEDTLAACVLLDENHRSYSLDDCCEREGIPGKDTELLEQAVVAYGGKRGRIKEYIWRLPARFVGPYAEQDGEATLELWQRCEPALRAQGVWDAYRTEMELLPMTVAMRRRGIPLDTGRTMRTRDELRQVVTDRLAIITREAGLRRAVTLEDIRSPRWMEKMCTEHSVAFPRTAKTKQGSFSADWMEKHEHWLPRTVAEALKFEDAATKFLETFLLGHVHNNRVHAEIHQFKSDDGGTRSHRFSYSSPPLQQMSSPDKDPRDEFKKLIEDRAIGTKIRRCFGPEKGQFWVASDFSGQEVRMAVHFAHACGAAGADSVVQKFLDNPRADFHQMVADMTGKPRWMAKIINFGLMYGKGTRSLAEDLGVPFEEAAAILADYHQRMPWIKALIDICKRRSSDRGFIRLYDGARMHYPLWEGGWMEWEERKSAQDAGFKLEPCTLQEARARQQEEGHPWARTRLRRADTRKSFNNLVQGSSARQTKIAMRNLGRLGVVPLIQMHDEIGISASSEREAQEVVRCMVEATPLVVPVIVDCEVGPTWGEAKMSWADCEAKYGHLLAA